MLVGILYSKIKFFTKKKIYTKLKMYQNTSFDMKNEFRRVCKTKTGTTLYVKVESHVWGVCLGK